MPRALAGSPNASEETKQEVEEKGKGQTMGEQTAGLVLASVTTTSHSGCRRRGRQIERSTQRLRQGVLGRSCRVPSGRSCRVPRWEGGRIRPRGACRREESREGPVRAAQVGSEPQPGRGKGPAAPALLGSSPRAARPPPARRAAHPCLPATPGCRASRAPPSSGSTGLVGSPHGTPWDSGKGRTSSCYYHRPLDCQRLKKKLTCWAHMSASG